jgi:hypothetical protein
MTMYIKIENGQTVGYPLVQGNMEYLFPEFNFNQIVTPDMIAPLGYAIYEFSTQPARPRYKKIQEGSPTLNSNGIWYQTWLVVDKTAEESAAEDAEQASLMRRDRDHRLMQTDWTQLPDAQITSERRQLFAEYRQQLRDVTAQPGFPWDINWPVKPD